MLVQGTSLGLVINWARLSEPAEEMPRLNLNQREAAMAQAQLMSSEKLAYDDAGRAHPSYVAGSLSARATAINKYVRTRRHAAAAVPRPLSMWSSRPLPPSMRELIRLHRTGEIDDATMRELERDLDLEELSAISANDYLTLLARHLRFSSWTPSANIPRTGVSA